MKKKPLSLPGQKQTPEMRVAKKQVLLLKRKLKRSTKKLKRLLAG
jgi:hypothetical protein